MAEGKRWRLCECGHRAFLQRWGWQCNGCATITPEVHL